MSNARLFLFLTLALIALVGAHLALDLKGMDSVRRVSPAVLAPEADGAATLTLMRPEKGSVVLMRTDAWRLAEPFSGAADGSVASRLVDALAFARVESTQSLSDLADRGESLADFGLAVPRLLVTVSSAKSVVSIGFGRTSPDGRSVYATRSDDRLLRLVSTNDFAAIDRTVDDLRAREVVTLAAEDVVSVDIRSEGVTRARFVRTESEWNLVQPREMKASAARLKALVGSLSSARADTFVWPVGASNETRTASAAVLAQYGLDPESAATLALKSSDGGDALVTFGRSAGEGRVYALIQRGTAVVTLDAALKDLVLSDAAYFTDTRLFPMMPDDITTLALQEGESSYLLSRDAAGDWQLETPVAAKADNAAVRRLLEGLLSLRPDALDPDGISVTLATNVPARIVRREAALGGVRLEDLRDKTVIRVDPARVHRLSVVRATGDDPKLSVVYDPDRRAWNLEGENPKGVPDEEAIQRLLTILNPLKATRIVALNVRAGDLTDYGLDAPAVTVAVDLQKEGPVRRNIFIGRDTPAGTYVTVGMSDAVFLVNSETAESLRSSLAKEESDVP